MTLAVTNLVAGYSREVPILRGLDMVAEPGRMTVIIGPNGAGKSTLLKTIYGYLTPQRGDITHGGRSLLGVQPKDMLREGIAYLIQGHSVFPNMTVQENLELGAWLLGGRRSAVVAAFEAVYARFPRLKEKRRRHGNCSRSTIFLAIRRRSGDSLRLKDLVS